MPYDQPTFQDRYLIIFLAYFVWEDISESITKSNLKIILRQTTKVTVYSKKSITTGRDASQSISRVPALLYRSGLKENGGQSGVKLQFFWKYIFGFSYLLPPFSIYEISFKELHPLTTE